MLTIIQSRHSGVYGALGMFIMVTVMASWMPLFAVGKCYDITPVSQSSSQRSWQHSWQRSSQHSSNSSSIADIISAASAGDTLRFHAGTYRQSGIIITKPLVLLAADGAEHQAILDAELQGTSIIVVRSHNVVIRGLALRNVPVSYIHDNAAIRAEGAQHCTFERLRIDNALFGIYLATSANCHIRQNILQAIKADESSSGNGIHLWRCDNCTIEQNEIQGHRDGVYLEFSRHALVRHNRSEGNMRYGLHFMFSDSCFYTFNQFRRNGSGVAVMYSRYVQMTDNHFENNWGAAAYGVLFKDITDSRMARNHFYKNTTALYAEGVSRTTVEDNEFLENGWAIKLFGSAINNTFTRNNIIGNSFDVSTNSFDSENRFEYNYWSRYEGYDLNRDGIGDIPFRPVRLFSVLVEQQQPALVLMHSLLISILDLAERIIPSMTPETLIDATPMMIPNHPVQNAIESTSSDTMLNNCL